MASADSLLEAVEAALRSISPPKWFVAPGQPEDQPKVVERSGGNAPRWEVAVCKAVGSRDAHLIAHAPEWLASLVALVRQAASDTEDYSHIANDLRKRLEREKVVAGQTLWDYDRANHRAQAAEAEVARLRERLGRIVGLESPDGLLAAEGGWTTADRDDLKDLAHLMRTRHDPINPSLAARIAVDFFRCKNLPAALSSAPEGETP